MKVILIRHGATYSNTLNRFVGALDEPLLESSIDKIKNKSYPDADFVYSSPLKRCVQTAKLIYLDKDVVKVNDLRECDFGKFEGKGREDLIDDKDYIEFMKNKDKISFPDGEIIEEFKQRCICSFCDIVSELNDSVSVAFVVHDGVIMSVLEKLAIHRKAFLEWKVKNAEGYVCDYSNGIITNVNNL